MTRNKSKNIFRILGSWIRRLFYGYDKDYVERMEKIRAEKQAAADDAEEIISPGRQAVNSFLERKLAVAALIFVVSMFIFVFVGPLFMPKYTDTYTEITQKNVRPNFSMMSVPRELAGDIKMIDGYSSFSVGLSNAGKVYVWGATDLGTTGLDMKDIPQEILDAKIVMVAAGFDHAIAIDENGKIYGWGNYKLGQYHTNADGYVYGENSNIAYMPEELVNGTVDVNNIKRLTCGYQATALLMNDGKLYVWGNRHAYANIDNFIDNDGMQDIGFTLNYIVGVPANGKSLYTGTRGLYDQVRSNVTGKAVSIGDYLDGRKIVSITTTTGNVCMQLDDNSLCYTGDFPTEIKAMPELAEGEYFVQLTAGTYHYTGITNRGNLYSWGGNVFNQAEEPEKVSGVSAVYSGAFQSYAVDESGDLLEKWGLRGYLFGTDTNGADIFKRLVNGGRMTMTIGAIAVVISSVIGIIVGCVSGYFGGLTDIILMRVTEIFSAIPFLPFALILSAVMAQMDISENQKIFIIMCILGLLTWTGLARLVRGQVLVARESEYVLAAKSMGVKERVIAFKHILPNVISVIMVNLTLNFATCMLTESSLSYLGFGVTFPRPTWGNMLNGANNATIIKNFWWQWLFTALFLAVTCVCINIVGDTLRDVMDPKSSAER